MRWGWCGDGCVCVLFVVWGRVLVVGMDQWPAGGRCMVSRRLIGRVGHAACRRIQWRDIRPAVSILGRHVVDFGRCMTG